MQYNIGYILPNQIDVYIHTEGTLRRYEKVYERTIRLYKEVDNTFTLVVRNQDQKAQFVDGTTTVLQISDSDNNLILTKLGTIIDDGSTVSSKGQIKFTITESDMLDLKTGYYHGAIKHTDSSNNTQIIYADTRYDAGIRFEVIEGPFPELIDSVEVKSFTLVDDEWVSSTVSADPNRNSNSALHTVAYYLADFSGSIKIYGTQTASSSYATNVQQSDFYLIDTKYYTSESNIQYINFNGVHTAIAFVVQSSDSSTVLTGINKILYRS